MTGSVWLPDYTSGADLCPKCTFPGCRYRYVENYTGTDSRPDMFDTTEHLKLTCNRCGYSWKKDVANAG
jgi:hypothetical protein